MVKTLVRKKQKERVPKYAKKATLAGEIQGYNIGAAYKLGKGGFEPIDTSGFEALINHFQYVSSGARELRSELTHARSQTGYIVLDGDETLWVEVGKTSQQIASALRRFDVAEAVQVSGDDRIRLEQRCYEDVKEKMTGLALNGASLESIRQGTVFQARLPEYGNVEIRMKPKSFRRRR